MVGIEKPKGSSTNKLTSIPVIDFSGLSDPTRRSSICTQVGQACETVGFFQIVNTGISGDVLNDAFDRSREFFDLSVDEKMKLAPDLGDNMLAAPAFKLGYVNSPTNAGTTNRLETMAFRHSTSLQRGGDGELESSYTTGSPTTGEIDPTKNWWPKNPRDYRMKFERLLLELGKIGDALLEVLSESLGLPRTYLHEYQNVASGCRVLYSHHYPQGTKADADETGVVPHRDNGFLSIVAQGYDADGLWINPYGEWIPLLPQKGGLVVNVGDILQVWTNGRYRSILHRVISNKRVGRYSFAYFFWPVSGSESEDRLVEPIPELSKESSAVYGPISFYDFFTKKFDDNPIGQLETYKLQASANLLEDRTFT